MSEIQKYKDEARKNHNKEKKMELARLMYEDRVHNDLSIRALAKKYGKAPNTVQKYLKDYAPSILEAPAQMYREYEIEKLDLMEEKLWTILEKKQVRVDHGKVIMVEDPDTGEERTLEDDEPAMKAIDRLLKISERRSKFLGLDKPLQMEHTHKAEIKDQELLSVLKQVQERSQAEEAEIVDAEIVEDGGSDVV